MASGHQKLHDVSPKEHLDRAAFLIAFAVGVVGGIFLKLLGVHPFGAALFSGVMLVAYAVTAWAGGRIKIEPEAIGDNCYYLGFLFTLSSLSFTLYQMAAPTTNGGSPIDIPEVISGFGVALSSTIVGVFLRVFMMQMRPDFVAKDRAIRADLNQSYADFRKNLSGILSQMKAFSTESIQFAAERDKRLRDATEQYLVDHQAALVLSADVLAKNIETSFVKAAEKAITEISLSVTETSDEAKLVLHEMALEIQALKDRLSEQESRTFEDIESRRHRLIAGLESAEGRMKEHDAVLEGYIKSTERAADTMTTRVVPALDDFWQRLGVLAKDAEFEVNNLGRPIPPEEIETGKSAPFTVMARRFRRSDS